MYRNKSRIDVDQSKKTIHMTFFFMQRLDKRLDEKEISYASGDYMTVFRYLHIIFNNLKPLIKKYPEKISIEVESKSFDDIIKYFNTKFSAIEVLFPNIRLPNVQFSIDQNIRRLDAELIQLLFDYNLLLPSENTKSLNDKLESDYEGEFFGSGDLIGI